MEAVGLKNYTSKCKLKELGKFLKLPDTTPLKVSEALSLLEILKKKTSWRSSKKIVRSKLKSPRSWLARR